MNTDYEKYFSYFHRSILSRYRVSPNLYSLEEDDMGGILNNYNDEQSTSYYEIRFAFRRLSNNQICVAAFSPDLRRLSDKEKYIWFGEQIESPKFAKIDPNFKRWIERYLKASWNVEDGPIPHIKRQIELAQALTRQKLQMPLFLFDWNPLIRYPDAENTEAYKDAHLELYRLLLDGLNPDCIIELAKRTNITLTDSSKKLNSLKELLPDQIANKIHKPLDECRKIRNKKHGVSSSRIADFPAFDKFDKDLAALEGGLRLLLSWLEGLLGISADICLKREQSLAHLFPRLVGPPQPGFKMAELKQIEGKTVSSVEFGQEEPNPEVHQGEAIILHFTDGTAMTIRIGSNVANLIDYRRKLKPSDFSTDIMVFWAPSIATS